MTFATISNLILTILCVVVVVQSLRMVKGIQQIRSTPMDQSIAQLDGATARAKAVLTELKAVLGTVSAEQHRAIEESRALRDELSVLIGIGNAVAERIVDAAAAPNDAKMEPEPEAATPEVATSEPAKPVNARPAPRSGNRGRRAGGGRRKPASEDTAAASDTKEAVPA